MAQHVLDSSDPAVGEVQKALQLATSSGPDPEVIKTIESALEVTRLREDFANYATSKGSATLNKIEEETERHDWDKVHREGNSVWRLGPSMLTGLLEGQFLKSLVSIQKAKRILEIGMFTGYSALAMAEALPADGEVVSIDREEYLKNLVTELVKSSPHHKKVKFIVGKALDVLKDLTSKGEKFDIIFLDADKVQYLNYFKVFFFDGGLLNLGGTILVDNAFFYGDGYIPSRGDTPTKQFVDTVAADPSLHKIFTLVSENITGLSSNTRWCLDYP